MGKQTAGLVIPCVIIGMVGVVLSVLVEQVLAGGNMSAAAGAKIGQEKSSSTFKTQNLPPAPDYGSPAAWAALPDPSIFLNGLEGWINGSYTKMGGRPLVQVNPLSWELNGPEVPASRNPGSLPAMEGTTGSPSLVPAVCGADASGKVLIINKPEAPGFMMPETDDTPILNTKYGDYHNYDYQLFYESIRKNALDRVNAFLVRKK